MGETQKAIKKYQIQIRDAAAKLEEEQRAKEHARDALVAAERKSNATQNALEEARTLLEQADRNRRTTEQELADELRAEQEGAQGLERGRKLGESQLKDMQGRFDEAETNALKGGKKAVNKLDTRIRELESELDAENRRFADAQKNLRKSE